MAMHSVMPFTSEPPLDLQTMVDVARFRATAQEDDLAFTFLPDGELQEEHLTYGELDLRARAIGAELQRRGAEGQRVLVLFDPGLDYIAAFYGCLYAGAVPVPVYPPDPFTLQRTLPRLQTIIDDAQASVVFGSEEIIGWCGADLLNDPRRQAMSLADVPAGAEYCWHALDGDRRRLAFLQYTSGSTGTPKGVMVSHANVLANLRAIHRLLDTEGVVAVTWLPPYHDMGLIGTVLLPVFSGRTTVFMSPMSFIQRPARWLQAITRYRGCTSAAPNFGYELCVRKVRDDECEGLDLSSWTVALSGAEPVRAETLERFVARFAPYGFRREALYPSYGMAEVTLMATGGVRDVAPAVGDFSASALERNEARLATHEGQPARRLVSCGRPPVGHELEIVDPDTCQVLHPGQVGEIWYRGPSVAQGYWNRTEETEHAFGARLAGDPRRRFLRTGDLGFVHRGELFVTGRLKDMLIFAGRNYYPQDIERTVERAHEGVKPDGVAAVGIELDNEERLVIVGEILRPKRFRLADVLRDIRRELAEEHGLSPHAVVLIAAGTLPKTTSGKICRNECRQRYLAGDLEVLAQWPGAGEQTAASDDLPAEGSAAPRSELEAQLVQLWSEVLGTTAGSHSNFFALGGQSLRAVQLMGRIRDELGLLLPISALFEHPTPAALSDEIQRVSRQSGKSLGTHDVPASDAGAAAVGPESAAALSFTQQRLWFLEQFAPGHPMTFVPVLVRLEGAVDVARLQRALAQVSQRHESLRTTFDAPSGQPHATIHDQLPPNWRFEDWRSLEPAAASAALKHLTVSERFQPFDCRQGPLWRVVLVQLADRQWALWMVFHHLVCDGRSIDVLVRDLATAYANEDKSAALPEVARQFADFVASQQAAWTADRLDAELAWWREYLAGAPELLELPADRARRPDRFDPETLVFHAPPALRRLVERKAAASGCTPFMVCLAAWQALLARYGACDEVCVAVASAGRDRPQWQGVVGCLLNTVVVRGDLSGDPDTDELLGRVRRSTIDALAHCDMPFEKLVEDLAPARHLGRMPLAQALLLFQDHEVGPRQLGDVQVAAVEVDYAPLAGFDVTLVVEPDGEGWKLSLAYNHAWYDRHTLQHMADALLETLTALADQQPRRRHALPIPARAQRAQLLGPWSHQHLQLPPFASAEDWIAAGCSSHPQRMAVVAADGELTYGELDRRSNRLARFLQSQGVRPDVTVGICLPRGVDLVVALLAVWKAGGAYVPLDPRYPSERLSYMIDDAGIGLMLASSDNQSSLSGIDVRTVFLDAMNDALAACSEARPVSQACGEHLAYVIYTSGSTGRPKGVMVRRRGVLNFLASMAVEPGLAQSDVMLAITTISFDIAVAELFLPLAVGARVVLAGHDDALDAVRLARIIEASGVSVVQATPATWRMLLADGWRPSPGLRIWCGGEALDPQLARQLTSTGNELWNLYGPTETTVWSTVARIDAVEDVVPIGRPLGNTSVYVLDEHRQPVPVGVPGELYLGGWGVARGYHNREDLTAERFVPDMFASGEPVGETGRLFRTGDSVRFRADGRLEFFGRLDAQVKIRGFRVEPAEVEFVLARHADVDEAAVVAQPDQSGEQRLVAFYVASGEPPPTPELLRKLVAAYLPDYMVPSLVVQVDKLPRTPAGKIDRRALPLVEPAAAVLGTEYVPPRTPLESTIAQAWCEVLRLERVGVHDNFFELGGHSLLATQLITRLRHAFAGIGVRQVFEHPTVAGLAEWCLAAEAQHVDADDLQALLDRLDGMTEQEAKQMIGDR